MKIKPTGATLAALLDGREAARALRSTIAERVRLFHQDHGYAPALAAVLVGDDAASQVYVRNKSRACSEVGIDSRLHHLPATTTTGQLIELIDSLNRDARVHGILVQLPLPAEIDTQRVLDSVSPIKDVDCFHPTNVGLLVQGRPRFLPCTPHGIVQLLARAGIEVAGRHAVVVGRSDIVGKPLAIMLAQRTSRFGDRAVNATVTLCHSQTRDLAEFTRRADILIAALGRPRAITAAMVKPGAVVIDVGINRVGDQLVGDVDFDAVRRVASWLTPVPGGVGPLTVAMLLDNTLEAALLQSA